MNQLHEKEQTGPHSRIVAVALGVTALIVLAAFSGLFSNLDQKSTVSEIYPEMESAIADAISVLDDFPGFESRDWFEEPCTDDAYVDMPSHVKVSLHYTLAFDNESAAQTLDTYRTLVENYWRAEQFSTTVGSGPTIIRAVLSDSLTIELDASDIPEFRVFTTGCLFKSDSEPEYISPLGGVMDQRDALAHLKT